MMKNKLILFITIISLLSCKAQIAPLYKADLDLPEGTYTNNYLSYAALTARYFDAGYQCICKSGIGVTISWFPLTMSEMYDRLVPTNPDSKWDFSLYTPDIVVVNLFQNDS